MESREHLIKLLDKPKARKYRDASLNRLYFEKLETIKPGAIAELNKSLAGPPPEYVFYTSFALGRLIKLTKGIAEELIKMGIPDSLTIRGDVEPEGLLAIINEMKAAKRLNMHNKEFRFSLTVDSPIIISKLIKLAESMTLDQQDELADNLDKIDIYMYTYVHKKFDLEHSAIKSVKLVTKALDILGSDIGDRLGSVGSWRSHREWEPSGNIVDRAAWVFTDTDNKVLVEGITNMLSNRIDKLAYWEIEKDFTGALVPIKMIQLKATMISSVYGSDDAIVVGAPHKPNDRVSSCVYKATSLVEELKDKMVRVKTWIKEAGAVSSEYKIVETGAFEYATIRIAVSLDSTLAKISPKQISALIDKCDSLFVFSFHPCLPNSGKFYDASVEAPASIDITELEQVKDPSRMLVSKGINLNGVDLSNVVGPDNQRNLHQFIIACLIGPPTDCKQDMCRTDEHSISLHGTFKINSMANGYTKTTSIHMVSGVDITYENLKPILNAIKSIEQLVTWLATAPITDGLYHLSGVSDEDVRKSVVNILIAKLCISEKLAFAIADMCGVSSCGIVFNKQNLELEARAALANYLTHAITQSSLAITIPASCQVSTRLSLEIKEFAAKRVAMVPDSLMAILNKDAKIWKVVCSDYYHGPTNQHGTGMYEYMHSYGIDEKAATLDEAFALDKDEKLKNAIASTGAATLYAGMPCVGFDKDSNYVYKIKEISEMCTSRMSGTNQADAADAGSRACISINPNGFNEIYNYLNNNLKARADLALKASAGLAPV